LILAPFVILAIYPGGWIYASFVAVCLTLGMREWLEMTAPAASFAVRSAAFAALLLALAAGFWEFVDYGIAVVIALTPTVFLLAMKEGAGKAAWTALGVPYLAASGLALIYLRADPEKGMFLVVYLVTIVWATDIGAFVSGRLIGGPKLLPEISPKKTWAGLLGGLVFAALAGYCAALVFGAAKPFTAGVFSIALAAAAQTGDMFESFVKRLHGVKDSGALIPGHGGILDRIDGLIFASVFFALFQRAAGWSLNWW